MNHPIMDEKLLNKKMLETTKEKSGKFKDYKKVLSNANLSKILNSRKKQVGLKTKA